MSPPMSQQKPRTLLSSWLQVVVPAEALAQDRQWPGCPHSFSGGEFGFPSNFLLWSRWVVGHSPKDWELLWTKAFLEPGQP
jgi:hypothetical protein